MAGALGEFEQLVLLAVLRLGDEAYGVTIRRAVMDGTGRDVSSGAVYTTLARLERRGFVSSRVGETAAERTGQRRKYYHLEPSGAQTLYRSHTQWHRMATGLVPRLAGLAAQAGEGND